MPLYFFALDDDLPCPESGEHLPDDHAACRLARNVVREVNCNRPRRLKVLSIQIYRENGAAVACVPEFGVLDKVQ